MQISWGDSSDVGLPRMRSLGRSRLGLSNAPGMGAIATANREAHLETLHTAVSLNECDTLISASALLSNELSGAQALSNCL
jgi:hypothetical protein